MLGLLLCLSMLKRRAPLIGRHLLPAKSFYNKFSEDVSLTVQAWGSHNLTTTASHLSWICTGCTSDVFQRKTVIRFCDLQYSFHCLTAKVCIQSVSSLLEEEVLPTQQGVGTKLGRKAAAHSTRIYANLPSLSPNVILTLDLWNGFNSISHDVVLRSVREKVTQLYYFAW